MKLKFDPQEAKKIIKKADEERMSVGALLDYTRRKVDYFYQVAGGAEPQVLENWYQYAADNLQAFSSSLSRMTHQILNEQHMVERDKYEEDDTYEEDYNHENPSY